MDYRLNPFDISGSMERAALNETGRGLSIADPITAYLDRDKIDPRIREEAPVREAPQVSREELIAMGYPDLPTAGEMERFSSNVDAGIPYGYADPYQGVPESRFSAGFFLGQPPQEEPRETPEEEEVGILQRDLQDQQDKSLEMQYKTTNLTTDPASALARHNAGGKIAEDPIKAPEAKDYSKMLQIEKGKQILFDQSKIPNWYESKSFFNGLLTMGLNLMAGRDVASAFGAAATVFDKNFGAEKRASWAEDLRAAGYDDTEIMRYIETGDNKVLTDPAEKQRKAIQDAAAQQQLIAAMRNNDPDVIQSKMDAEVRKEQREIARDQRSAEYQAAQIEQMYNSATRADRQLALEELKFKKKTDDEEAAEFGFSPQENRAFVGQLNKALGTVMARLPFSITAGKDLADIKRYLKNGDSARLAGAFKTFQANQGRALKGGNAMLTQKDMDSVVGMLSLVDQGRNILSLNIGGTPIEKWIRQQEGSVQDDQKNLPIMIKDYASNMYKSMKAAGKSHENISGFLNRNLAASGVGALEFDSEGNVVGLEESKKQSKAGPSTVYIQR